MFASSRGLPNIQHTRTSLFLAERERASSGNHKHRALRDLRLTHSSPLDWLNVCLRFRIVFAALWDPSSINVSISLAHHLPPHGVTVPYSLRLPRDKTEYTSRCHVVASGNWSQPLPRNVFYVYQLLGSRKLCVYSYAMGLRARHASRNTANKCSLTCHAGFEATCG